MATKKMSPGLDLIRLTAVLSARVNDLKSLNEPFVLQSRIPQTRSRHVVVIWDAWSTHDGVARSKVILDAFEKSGQLNGDRISVAMGLTQQQAAQMGYLPFGIVPMVRADDPVSLADCVAAMEHVGGVVVRTGASIELRFPSRASAQAAYRQLSEKIPGPYWTLEHESAGVTAE